MDKIEVENFDNEEEDFAFDDEDIDLDFNYNTCLIKVYAD